MSQAAPPLTKPPAAKAKGQAAPPAPVKRVRYIGDGERVLAAPQEWRWLPGTVHRIPDDLAARLVRDNPDLFEFVPDGEEEKQE